MYYSLINYAGNLYSDIFWLVWDVNFGFIKTYFKMQYKILGKKTNVSTIITSAWMLIPRVIEGTCRKTNQVYTVYVIRLDYSLYNVKLSILYRRALMQKGFLKAYIQ